jgi:uncharacterized protein YaaQ
VKLVVAAVQDRDSEAVTTALVNSSFRVTKVSGTGGFLRRGSTTLLVGVDDHEVETVVGVIRNTARPGEETSASLYPDRKAGPPGRIVVGRAPIFVLDVESHQRV